MDPLQSAPASPSLQRFVRAFAQRDLHLATHDLVQPVPASLEHVLEFEFFDSLRIADERGAMIDADRCAVVGPHTRPGYHVHLRGRIQSFAIFFQPFGLWQLFRIPNRELADRFYPARDLLGPEVHELWHRLADCPSFDLRVAAAELYLFQRASGASARTPIMNAAVQLFHERGTGRIHQFAADSSLSVRHFERRFTDETGITPKLFARITRFQNALDARLTAPGRSWLDIAHDLGYFDQMHMVRDFHSLSGASPTQILSALGDTRPPALAAS